MSSIRRALFLAGLFSVVTSAPAYSNIITDTYWGGTPYDSVDRDIVGTNGAFDISQMEVVQSGNVIDVNIYSRFLNNIGSFGVNLGDLFISTDGWAPDQTASNYANDDASTGTDWEYVLVFDNHEKWDDSDSTIQNIGGNVSLYSVNDDQIILSDYYFSTGHRSNQEVQYNTTNQNSLATYNWSIDFGTDSTWQTDTEDYLSLSFLLSDLGISNGETLAFHWGMTCGNDVIEGAFKTEPVPEPNTLLLFGTGLAALTGFGARRKK